MDWLLNLSERYRTQIQTGPFFQRIETAQRPSDLSWVYQLIHQSREFTQSLCLRYSLCHDRRYQSIFAEHAVEEADHPDQLMAWMTLHGFLDGGDPATQLPTQETVNNLAFCWRAAVREPHDVQIVTLNVLSEGVALDFYSAVIPVLDRLGLLSGRYWKVHREIDSHHLRMGLDQFDDTAMDSAAGRRYQHVLWQSASLYHQMLSSWVGVRAEPLVSLSSDPIPGHLLIQPERRASTAV